MVSDDVLFEVVEMEGLPIDNVQLMNMAGGKSNMQYLPFLHILFARNDSHALFITYDKVYGLRKKLKGIPPKRLRSAKTERAAFCMIDKNRDCLIQDVVFRTRGNLATFNLIDPLNNSQTLSTKPYGILTYFRYSFTIRDDAGYIKNHQERYSCAEARYYNSEKSMLRALWDLKANNPQNNYYLPFHNIPYKSYYKRSFYEYGFLAKNIIK